MNPLRHIPKNPTAALLVAGCLLAPTLIHASPQHTTALQPDAATPHRLHLILKDGSYQIVMSYKIVGNVVHYISAERGGAEEEIPLSMVDLDATKRWEKQHTQSSADPNNPEPPAIDPGLRKGEVDVAPPPQDPQDPRPPEEDSPLAPHPLHSTPELVPLAQTDSDLNRNTGHNLLK